MDEEKNCIIYPKRSQADAPNEPIFRRQPLDFQMVASDVSMRRAEFRPRATGSNGGGVQGKDGFEDGAEAEAGSDENSTGSKGQKTSSTRQTHSQTATGLPAAVERVEEVFKIMVGQAGALVGNRPAQRSRIADRADDDRLARGGRLDRVAN